MIRFISGLCQAGVLYFATLGLMLAIKGLLPAVPGPIFWTALMAGVVGSLVRMATP